MKNFFTKIKPVLIVIFWITCGGIFLVMTVAGINKQQHLTCNNLQIFIDNKIEVGFVDEQDVKQILLEHGFDTLIGKQLSSIDFHRLEQLLDNNVYIFKSRVFANSHGGIEINIQQRKPILRIINNEGVSYYIDENNSKMPPALKFTARVPVATGFIFNNGTDGDENDTLMINRLFRLAQFLQKNKFFESLTEQIIVDDNREIEIIPSLGNFTILLGDATNLQEKFNKLDAFYHYGIGNGKNYKQIDLRFLNQIYAQQRNFKPGKIKTQTTKTDTTLNNIKPNDRNEH